MRYLLLLAIASLAIAADTEKEVEPEELKPAESALPIRVHEDERRYHFEDGLELIRSRDERSRLHLYDYRHNKHHDYGDVHDHDHGHHGHHGPQGPERVDLDEEHYSGPLILRSPLHIHDHPDIDKQNKIIADVYSPDYYQPTWLLDYRYLKTGGRDYTRGPGGQILILPKNVKSNEHKDFPDFDALLEHLRLSRLSEHAKSYRHGYGYDHHHRGHHHVGLGQYGRHHGYHHQHNPWKSDHHH